MDMKYAASDFIVKWQINRCWLLINDRNQQKFIQPCHKKKFIELPVSNKKESIIFYVPFVKTLIFAKKICSIKPIKFPSWHSSFHFNARPSEINFFAEFPHFRAFQSIFVFLFPSWTFLTSGKIKCFQTAHLLPSKISILFRKMNFWCGLWYFQLRRFLERLVKIWMKFSTIFLSIEKPKEKFRAVICTWCKFHQSRIQWIWRFMICHGSIRNSP